MLIRADQEERGLQMIMKMPDPEESCYMLLKIGQQRHAVQVAINNKKSQLIQDIRQSISDNQAKEQLEMYLSQNDK
ncbi:unnamed protein product [Paramecium sonneborni]|uniref:Uncharacterized protein n=1 Tax=Paramecium sonneborni TaxID=65129 RepID=A0A8S1N5Q9_9CILI|nr:unnamed protein product [Paramecium sonneborni]